MRRLKRGAGFVLLLIGAVALLPALWLSPWAWTAATATKPMFARDVVASEPAVSAENCEGRSNCWDQNRTEWALDHDKMIQGERHMILKAFFIFFGTGVVLLGVGVVLFRNGAKQAQA